MSYKSDYKIDGFFEYVVPPLEGFWWQDGVKVVDCSDKSSFHWISVIRPPDFVTENDFATYDESLCKKIEPNVSTTKDLFSGADGFFPELRIGGHFVIVVRTCFLGTHV